MKKTRQLHSAACAFAAISSAVLLVSALAFILRHRSVSAAGVEFANTVRFAPPSDPWSDSQTVQASDLVKELAESKGSARPIVVCTGFRPLFAGAHVPGAVFHGAAQSDQGLADLKKWAQGIPRDANLVVYCGCCPMAHCPNIRPAFQALQEMGFTRLRVLVLPHDFATDWVEKGYPVEKGRRDPAAERSR
jgi:thiosulfate/3-mercaptopyruvate sulfurtransferase